MNFGKCLLYTCAFVLFAGSAFGEDTVERLKTIEEMVLQQAQTIQEQQKAIEVLQEEVAKRKRESSPQEAANEESPSSKVTGFFGGSFMTNPNISLVLDTSFYASSRKQGELETAGIPRFTTQGADRHKGFNLTAAELFLFAPVDPYYNLYANIPISEDGAEIEEAYAITTSLPEGLQLKGGRFKSNFSRLDGQHPHAWDFADIALPYRTFLGTEGLGGENGIQATWLPPLPFYLQVGGEVLQGQNDLLFGSSGSYPKAFTLFTKTSFDTGDDSTLFFGPFVLLGKTKNLNIVPDGTFTGKSSLYGMEAVWKWKPSSHEGLTLQGEYLFLDQRGRVAESESNDREPLKRRQDGLYVQGVYQLDRWRFAARYDALELFANSFKRNGEQNLSGNTPWRTTAAVDFNPSEFTRIRAQYTYDRSSGQVNNEGIIQFIFGIGAHAGHTF